jgi:hypothetical protein
MWCVFPPSARCHAPGLLPQTHDGCFRAFGSAALCMMPCCCCSAARARPRRRTLQPRSFLRAAVPRVVQYTHHAHAQCMCAQCRHTHHRVVVTRAPHTRCCMAVLHGRCVHGRGVLHGLCPPPLSPFTPPTPLCLKHPPRPLAWPSTPTAPPPAAPRASSDSRFQTSCPRTRWGLVHRGLS